MLYGTTPDFLRCFGLNSLRDLPDVEGAGNAEVLMNLTIDDMLTEQAENGESTPEAEA